MAGKEKLSWNSKLVISLDCSSTKSHKKILIIKDFEWFKFLAVPDADFDGVRGNKNSLKIEYFS